MLADPNITHMSWWTQRSMKLDKISRGHCRGDPLRSPFVAASSAGVFYKSARPERGRHPATTNMETPPITTLRWEFPIKKTGEFDQTKKNLL